MSVSIRIEHATKRFGKKTIIPDLSLEIKKGEFSLCSVERLWEDHAA